MMQMNLIMKNQGQIAGGNLSCILHYYTDEPYNKKLGQFVVGN